MEELGIGSRVRHPQYGDGVVVNVKSGSYMVTFINEGKKEISREHNVIEVIEAVEPPDDMISNADIERTLISILRRWTEIPENVSLGSKWTGGKMILQPGDKNVQSKEIPIDNFFS